MFLYILEHPFQPASPTTLTLGQLLYQHLLFSHYVTSNSLWPHGLQHARLPCPSLSLGVYSSSCPLSRWCYLTVLSSAALFYIQALKTLLFLGHCCLSVILYSLTWSSGRLSPGLSHQFSAGSDVVQRYHRVCSADREEALKKHTVDELMCLH